MGDCTRAPLVGVCPGNSAYDQLERIWLGIPELDLAGDLDGCGCSVGCWAIDDSEFLNGGTSRPYPMSSWGTRWLRPFPGSPINRLANGEESPIESLTTNEFGMFHPVYRIPPSIKLQRAAAHRSHGRECFDESACEAWPPVCSSSAPEGVLGPPCIGAEDQVVCHDFYSGNSPAFHEVLGGKWPDLFFSDSLNLADPWCRTGLDPSGPKTVNVSSTDVLAKPVFLRSFKERPGGGSTPEGHSVNALIPCVERIRKNLDCGMSAYLTSSPSHREGAYSGSNIAGVFQQWGMSTHDQVNMPHFLLGDEAERRMKNAVLRHAFREELQVGTDQPQRLRIRMDRVDKGDLALDMWSRRWEPVPFETDQTYDETVDHPPAPVGETQRYVFQNPLPIWRFFQTQGSPIGVGEFREVDDDFPVPITIVAKMTTGMTFSVTLNGVGSGITHSNVIGPQCDGSTIVIGGNPLPPANIGMTYGRWKARGTEGAPAIFEITTESRGGDDVCPGGDSFEIRLLWDTQAAINPDIDTTLLPLVIGAYGDPLEFTGKLARSGHALIIEARLYYVQLDLSLVAELYDSRATPAPTSPSSMRLRPHIRVEMHCKVVYRARLADEQAGGPDIVNPTLDYGERPTVDGDTILYSFDGIDMRLPPPTRFSWWGWTGRLENAGDRWGANIPGNLGCCNIQKQLSGTMIYGWPTHVESHPSSDEEPQNPSRAYGGYIRLTRFPSLGICDQP